MTTHAVASAGEFRRALSRLFEAQEEHKAGVAQGATRVLQACLGVELFLHQLPADVCADLCKDIDKVRSSVSPHP